MATFIEGNMPLSVECSTNTTQHRASGLVESLWSSYSATSNWQLAITALLVLVAYDQCKLLLPYYIQLFSYVLHGSLIREQTYTSHARDRLPGPSSKSPLLDHFCKPSTPSSTHISPNGPVAPSAACLYSTSKCSAGIITSSLL